MARASIHRAPYDLLFWNQVWEEVLPAAIRQADGTPGDRFASLVSSRLFGDGGSRLLPKFLAVIDTTDIGPVNGS
jgi:hypothetical protein